MKLPQYVVKIFANAVLYVISKMLFITVIYEVMSSFGRIFKAYELSEFARLFLITLCCFYHFNYKYICVYFSDCLL